MDNSNVRRDCGRCILAMCTRPRAPVHQVHHTCVFCKAVAWRVMPCSFPACTLLYRTQPSKEPITSTTSYTVQMSVGTEVVRGPDWPPSCHVDGGGRGRITSIQSNGMVVVKWEKSASPYKHRWGVRSCFDLALAPSTPMYPFQQSFARPPAIQPRAPFSPRHPNQHFNTRPPPRLPYQHSRPLHFRPRPPFPRTPMPRPPTQQLHNVVSKSLYRCVGGHRLQVAGIRLSSWVCAQCCKP